MLKAKQNWQKIQSLKKSFRNPACPLKKVIDFATFQKIFLWRGLKTQKLKPLTKTKTLLQNLCFVIKKLYKDFVTR
jgi:hypothetical protein